MRKSRRGASLLLVVILLFFVMTVGLGVVFIAGSSSGQTSVALTQRQADLTAQSVLNALVSEIKAGDIVPDPTKTLDGGTSTASVTDSKLGAYKYSISSYNGSKTDFKVTVDAWYPKWQQGSESKMYRVVRGNLSSGVFNTFVQATGTGSSFMIDISHSITGDISVNSDLTFSNEFHVNGDIDVNGKLEVAAGTDTIGSSGSPTSIRANGFYLHQAYLTTIGNIYVTGDVDIGQCTSYQTGNIYATGNVILEAGSVYKLTGNIYAGKTVINNGGGTISGRIYQNVSNIASLVEAPIVNQTNLATIPTLSNTVTVDMSKNSTVTSSGILNFTNTYYWYNNNDGYKVTFDATNQDLYLTLIGPTTQSDTWINLGDAAQDYLTDYNESNVHNVYLYLSDNTGNKYVNLSIGSGSFLGDKAYYNYLSGLPNGKQRSPNLYIISNGPSKIVDNTMGVFDGYIYAPKGTVQFTGNGSPFLGTAKMIGSVIASSISLNNYDYIYKPVPGQVAGGISSGSGGWDYDSTLGTYVGN